MLSAEFPAFISAADVLNQSSFVHCEKLVFKGKLKRETVSPGKLCRAGTREDLSLHDLSSDFSEGSASQLVNRE